MYRALDNCLFILLALNSFTQSTKWLTDNPGFDDPSSWLDEHLPCSKEQVVFPQSYHALLPLPKIVDVGGFLLGNDGAILLQEETTITLGGESRNRDCDTGIAVLKEPTVRKWFNPTTWHSSKEQQENMAIPDIERIPCNNESVIIDGNGPLALDLEHTPYLRLGQLSVAGFLISKDYLKELLYTDLGQFLFKNQEGVNVEYYYNDVCGCHKDFNTFNEPICHNVVDTCPRPHCLVPIVPYGSCCAICGSVLRFSVEYCETEKIHVLEDIIRKGLKEKNLEDDLYFYVNYINSYEYGNYLQAIIVDRNSYSEKSVNFMKYLNETANWMGKFKRQLKFYRIEYSGRPYNPNITFGSILLIMLCFIFVSIVALVIFAHYQPDNRYLYYIPRWVYDPRLWHSFVNRSNNVFARFDNTRVSVQTISPESHTKRAFSMGYEAGSGRIREQAFDNPMFDEVPSSSQVGCKKETPDGRQSAPQCLIESVDILGGPEKEEEQELAEIKLESSSDEEEQQETRE